MELNAQTLYEYAPFPGAYRDLLVETIWREFADALFDETETGAEELAKRSVGFEAGTNKEDIWRWFDQEHSKGVYYLLYTFDPLRFDPTDQNIVDTDVPGAKLPPLDAWDFLDDSDGGEFFLADGDMVYQLAVSSQTSSENPRWTVIINDNSLPKNLVPCVPDIEFDNLGKAFQFVDTFAKDYSLYKNVWDCQAHKATVRLNPGGINEMSDQAEKAAMDKVLDFFSGSPIEGIEQHVSPISRIPKVTLVDDLDR